MSGLEGHLDWCAKRQGLACSCAAKSRAKAIGPITAEWVEACRTHNCYICDGGDEVLAINLRKCWLYICNNCAEELGVLIAKRGTAPCP